MSDIIRILIVEDLQTDAELAERETSGALPRSEFMQVDTREDFLAALTSFNPDLILSDYKLPRFDGMSALKLALERVPDTPFIILTGSMDEETAVACMKAGAWDYVIKEHIMRLGPAVLNVLEQKRLRREQQLAEEARRVAEARYRLLFDDSPDGIVILDPGEARILEFNETACRQLGYSREEFSRLRVPDFDAAETSEETAARIAKVMREGRGNFETLHRTKQGEIRNILVTAQVSELSGRPVYHCVWRDITDRKRAELQLEKEHRQLLAIFNSLSAVINIMDPLSHEVVFSNRYAREIIGFDPVGKKCHQVFHRAEEPCSFCNNRRLIENKGSSEQWDFWLETLQRHLMSTDRIILWPDGRELKLEFAIDITSFKAAEAALRNSEHQLGQIIDLLPDATLVIDKQGKVIAWNRAMTALTGVRSEDMIGKGDLEYAIPFYGKRRPILIDFALRSRPEWEEKYTGMYWKGDILVGEAFVPNLPRGIAHLSATAAVLRDAQGEVTAAIECIRDNTERRQMEEKLRETRDFLENLLDYANAPIIVWDSRFRITRFNRAFERLTGRKSGDVLGLGLELLFPLDKREESISYIRRTSGGERWETVEIPVQHVDGRVCTLLWNSATLYGTDGETVVATIAQGHDITQWRQAQEAQQKLEAQLAQARKMEAIGTLAGGIAHDFNNILGIIMGHAEIAQINLAQDSPMKRNIDEVLKATYRAKDLVNQILTFSRKSEQSRRPMEVIPVIKEALKLLRASLPMTVEIHPEMGLPPGDDLILGDPTQVQQILMNLSVNAAHAMRGAGGTLKVALCPKHFSASDAAKPLQLNPGDYLKLTVQDSGHGMDQTILDHIFDPFFTTKGPGEGTGLGLAVVHGIVSSHGGALTVSSRIGEGTTFCVYFPKLESGVVAETEIASDPPRGTERILLIDDEEPLADALKQCLEYLGYKVTAKTSSPEALLAFRKQPEDFDLVITDYTMPKMTGTELAEQIMQVRPNIPIILCTGFNERISEEGSRRAGVCDFLLKPVSIRELAEAIRRILQPLNAESLPSKDTSDGTLHD